MLALASALALPLLGGCGSGDSVPTHTADEQKLVDQLKNETPEQQIERIQKGPMPESAKAAMIQKIKDEHGIK
ncbi:hypothetical protein EON82_15285 [bacterium]|nr:MAG: hypothetical protein EON82_15285 [bacterium]